MAYIIVIHTGFCDYFVQYTAPHAQHVRTTTSLARAVRFPTAEAARKYRQPGEELRYVGGGS